MTNQEILDHIAQAAVEVLKVDASTVTETARFADDLDADSLDLVELIMALEDQLDITIPEGELEEVVTVGDAAKVIQAKLSPPA
jgi:acyl carrier protein